MKRDPEVVTKAGIDNALYSIIGEDRVDIGGTAGTFEDIENAIVVFARIRLAYQRKINEDTILSNAAASKSGQEPFQNDSTTSMSGKFGPKSVSTSQFQSSDVESKLSSLAVNMGLLMLKTACKRTQRCLKRYSQCWNTH